MSIDRSGNTDPWSPIPDEGDRLGRRKRIARQLGIYVAPKPPVLTEPIQTESGYQRDTLRFRTAADIARVRRLRLQGE